MKVPARDFLLRFIIASLSVTAMLGIITILRARPGETGLKILATAVATDIASVLALCCTGPAKSALHRAVQVTGILSTCISLAAGLYLLWLDPAASDRTEAILRASAVLVILAVASAHTCLVVPLSSHSRLSRAVVSGTVLCIAAAAELIANYALFPHFNPPGGYLRALTVLLILDALGTIVTLLMHRFTPHIAPPDLSRGAA